MAILVFGDKISRYRFLKRIFRLLMATLVLLALTVGSGAIAIAWFAGKDFPSQRQGDH
jgi:hypothetical protein